MLKNPHIKWFVNTSNRHGTHVFFIIKLNNSLFIGKKSAKKTTFKLSIMNNSVKNNYKNEPKVQNEESIKVHDYGKNPDIPPFKILQKNNEFSIILGNHIVSERKFETLEKAEHYVKSKPYELIIALVGMTYEMFEKIKLDKETLKDFKNETK